MTPSCLFLKDEKGVPVILYALNHNASGHTVNRNKSDIYTCSITVLKKVIEGVGFEVKSVRHNK